MVKYALLLKMIITAPVCDMRKTSVQGQTFDKHQETQLVAGDHVVAMEESGNYLLVEALDQRGYRGWIRRDATQEVKMFPERMPCAVLGREEFVNFARTFLGQPYCWGGCSPPTPHSPVPTGVDCSGLMYLCARHCGINISRNVRDQIHDCGNVTTPQPGDLIFSAPRDNPTKIEHVMIYLGNSEVLHASGKGQQTGVIITKVPEDEVLYARTLFNN